jgi:hypothetical protein
MKTHVKLLTGQFRPALFVLLDHGGMSFDQGSWISLISQVAVILNGCKGVGTHLVRDTEPSCRETEQVRRFIPEDQASYTLGTPPLSEQSK